ncbi:MAG: amidohydrolase family protein [Acidimicrobiales bacterium]
MDSTSTTASAPHVLDDIQIIDCDAHFTEQPDLWSSRVAASMRGRVPEHRTVDGITSWYYKDELWASLGGNVIGTGREKFHGGTIFQPFERVDACAWSVAERLRLMDDMGIYAQVIYPNGVGFSSNHIFAIDDLADRTLILQTYNDFFVDIQVESKNRLFPQAILPIWDMELTLKEMTRLLDKGIRGFTLSDKPELLGLPELPESYFAPMWDLFNESGAVANFHIGSGRRKEEKEAVIKDFVGAGVPPEMSQEIVANPSTVPNFAWRSFGTQRRMTIFMSSVQTSNMRIIANLCMSNLFDRYPKLQIVSAESGIGWVPFLLESLEYAFSDYVVDASELAQAQRRPTEYFRDHIYVMFWFENSGPQKLIEEIGVNNILVETDVPHPTCLFPNARDQFAKSLAGVSDHARRRILQDNGAELYSIPLSVPSALG